MKFIRLSMLREIVFSAVEEIAEGSMDDCKRWVEYFESKGYIQGMHSFNTKEFDNNTRKSKKMALEYCISKLLSIYRNMPNKQQNLNEWVSMTRRYLLK